MFFRSGADPEIFLTVFQGWHGILISNFDTFHMNDPIPVHVCVMIVYVLTGYAKTENALDNELKVCS
jgi:hypothetical protein